MILWTIIIHPVESGRALSRLPATVRAMRLSRAWRRPPGKAADTTAGDVPHNPLRAYFEAHTTGRGIFKWLHYFDFYHRHLEKFVGQDVHIVEIGVFSGGSMEMWKEYFGPLCQISGIDLEEACRVYEGDRVRIFIGDQEDRNFWARFRAEAPPVDVLIDDGGHTPEQQMVTLEEMLPHLKPGGVFICEDIHGRYNRFAAFAAELGTAVNDYRTDSGQQAGAELRTIASGWQADIGAIHVYPFAVVIEKAQAPVDHLLAPRHGTEWQAFQ
jgi:hypothetical protein